MERNSVGEQEKKLHGLNPHHEDSTNLFWTVFRSYKIEIVIHMVARFMLMYVELVLVVLLIIMSI